MNFLVLLAQSVPATQATQPVPLFARPEFVLMIIVGAVLLYTMSSSSKAKKAEQKKRDNLLSNLKRGNRVQTIGGMLGTVVDTRENEVVLKVDESSNTKIRFAREAIKRVVVEEETAVSK